MNPRVSSYFFFVLLLGAVVAAILVLLPFLMPLVLAAAGTMLVQPIFRLQKRVWGEEKGGRTVSAFLTVIIVLIVVLVPLFFLVGSIYSEVQTLYGSLTDEANRSQVIDALNSASLTLSNSVFGILPAHSFDTFNVTSLMKSGLELAFANLDKVFTGIAEVAGYVFIFLLAMFYFLRDGRAMVKRFISWSPVLIANETYIIRSFKRAIVSVFAGTFSVSLLEGISTGLAFLVFGIPAPALWGTVAAVASLVPGFGTSLVILPGVAYLALTGNYLFALGLLVWGYTAIFLVDHTLGPVLMNRGMNVHPFLVLLSVLGGITVFGLTGFFLGPIILVCLFTLLDIYKNSFIAPGPTA